MDKFRVRLSKSPKGNYGFIHGRDLPEGIYQSRDLPFIHSKWAVTGDFRADAKNHCAAIFVTNLALYFAKLGYKNLVTDDSISYAFQEIHEIIGNGPVPAVARKAQAYFAKKGYRLRYKHIRSYRDLKQAILLEHPMGILLTEGAIRWHWVMGVGWRAYDTGQNYIRVVDGWKQSGNRFYPIRTGASRWFATEYWLAIGSSNKDDISK